MAKDVIATKKAPAAIGPYSQGVRAGDRVYISGQLPIEPATGKLISGDIKAATRQVIENVKGILEEAGLDLGAVVKITLYIRNMDDFGSINEIYAAYFKSKPPARACVEVSRLPKDAAIEMDAIAYRG